MKALDASSYPALFRSADDASNRKQSAYLNLIRGEFFLLFLAAFLAMENFSGTVVSIAYAALFIISIGLLLTRTFLQFEQGWYRCRALAESIKTSTWRYMMGAEPFVKGASADSRRDFQQHLVRIFRANETAASAVSANYAAEAQISEAMEAVRQTSLRDRKTFYISQRVQEQREWYVAKAVKNRASVKTWVFVSVLIYAIAGLMALIRIAPTSWHFWPMEPMLVIASSIIGWMSIKKYSELAAAYTITAHEIGLIRPTIEDAETETSFSIAVNEAELAFSREHTLWIARQTS
jgi:hypothetical protein